MWGAIVGDLAGSIYEYEQSKNVTPVEVSSNLITKDSFYTDDTILTIAIYDAILNNHKYEDFLRMYGKAFMNYKPQTSLKNVFEKPFSPRFIKWVNREVEGNSSGNGALMRISGVGLMFDNEDEVIKNAILATEPSHNSKEAIETATTMALFIFYARKGYKFKEILRILNLKDIKYVPFKRFNTTCKETLNNCLYAMSVSTNFEMAIKKVISFGGDTDTNAAITGAMSEFIFVVPPYLVEKARAKIPVRFANILDTAYDIQRQKLEEDTEIDF